MITSTLCNAYDFSLLLCVCNLGTIILIIVMITLLKLIQTGPPNKL